MVTGYGGDAVLSEEYRSYDPGVLANKPVTQRSVGFIYNDALQDYPSPFGNIPGREETRHVEVSRVASTDANRIPPPFARGCREDSTCQRAARGGERPSGAGADKAGTTAGKKGRKRVQGSWREAIDFPAFMKGLLLSYRYKWKLIFNMRYATVSLCSLLPEL
jgi:hypothetical protein